MEKLRAELCNIRIPEPGEKVYKDECVLTFDSPESETGLYVCLKTFIGFGRSVVEEYSDKTKNRLFLHIGHIKTELPLENENEPEKKIARLAIGMAGGFNPDAGKKKYKIDERLHIVLLPQFFEVSYPSDDLPEMLCLSADGIVRAESALAASELEATAASWDGELRQVSGHSQTLKQLDSGVKIPPSDWQCRDCDLRENLWLNLTDGAVLCGRKQLDGSGGNNHALQHYNNSGHPLAVKLGTITSEGKADVYSYAENDMVLDSNLEQHLAHFGINPQKMRKTDKTMLELEIDINQRAWEWTRLTEAGHALTPVYGPGYTGLTNLGNSCYMNSVLQVLLTVPSYVRKYFAQRNDILGGLTDYTKAPFDFNVQMAKLANGVLSGRYSIAPPETPVGAETSKDPEFRGLSAAMLRGVVGRGHSEFSTKRQQDAMEYLEHLHKLVARNCVNQEDPSQAFKFEVEDRFVCSESGKVRYVKNSDMYLPLPVPLDAATNKEELSKSKSEGGSATARIPFASCLSQLVAPEEIHAFSSAAGKQVAMTKTTRLTTFPDYLFVQLVKFGLSSDWQPFKFDVSIAMPDELDLGALRAKGGPQPGEEVMREEEQAGQEEPPAVDESVVSQLAEMGFPETACRKASALTAAGFESALNWVMEHMEDADFEQPLPQRSKGTGAPFIPNEEGMQALTSMGFSTSHARLALKNTDNDLPRAADWIFSHQPQLDELVAKEAKEEGGEHSAWPYKETVQFTNGPPVYSLKAFISHMGTSLLVGHYVCHVRGADGSWVLINDEKVLKSEDPPKDMGYIYLYERVKGE